MVRRRLRPGDAVVDATAGNGQDTLFLARCVGENGRVYAFDLQSQALAQTQTLLEREAPELISCVTTVLAGHETMAEVIPPQHVGNLGAVMFNLGYLPGGDPKLITRPETTALALKIAAKWLRSGGILSVVVYTGHAGAAAEEEYVKQFFFGLTQGWNCWGYKNLNPSASAPYLLTAVRL
jgi:16S rRNA C1402 N4-methylase RsmH